MEVKVKAMQGIHTIWRDRTSQVIKCKSWSTRLCLYPSLIQKMKTYLELEGKLGPKPRPKPQTRLQQTCPEQTQPQPTKSSTKPMIRKAPGPKLKDKRKRTMIAKRRYKVRVLTQPTPPIPTSTAPTPKVATVSTQTPVVRSTVESIPVTVYILVMRKFAEILCLATRSQNEGSNPQPLEDMPNAPVRQSTHWPNSGSASKNLIETRKDWPIPPTPAPTPALNVKTEEPPQDAAIPHTMVMPKQVAEKCSWGLYFPICKKEEEHKENWHGNV